MDINALIIALLIIKIIVHLIVLYKHKVKMPIIPRIVEVVLPLPRNSIPLTDDAKFSRIVVRFLAYLILGFMILATLQKFGAFQ